MLQVQGVSVEVGGKLIVKTDKDAPRGKLISIDLKKPAPAGWKRRRRSPAPRRKSSARPACGP